MIICRVVRAYSATRKDFVMSKLLRAHFEKLEKSLISQSDIPGNSGHPQHKGFPRESFIREFLDGHLSERVAIGTGEIIDVHSEPDGKRNQHDIIIYRRSYPKIHIGGNICAFLSESVVATIEVKSTLDKDELKKAVKAAHNTKRLERNSYVPLPIGYQPPSILSYVVAYNGPARIKTVYKWLSPIYKDLHISYPVMGSTFDERMLCPSPALDGIFVLGKGFVQFDNSAVSFTEFEQARDQGRVPQNVHWRYSDMRSGSLQILFLSLTRAINSLAESYLLPHAYIPKYDPSLNFLGYGP